MIPILIVTHVVAGVIVLALGPRWRRWTFVAAGAPLAAATIAVVSCLPAVGDGTPPLQSWTWVTGLSLRASFRLDGFASAMALVVTGIGVVVLTFAAGYFGDEVPTRRVARCAGLLCLFAGAMLGLVTAGDVWTLFVFWEATSVVSFLLIGLDDREAGARIAAQRALLVTAAGGLVMLAGIACLVQAAGTTDLGELVATVPSSATAQAGAVMVLIGAMSKSAQVPLHFWLPGAMAAPTPVSAYLHSATMVKAGVVVVARVAPAFAAFGWWRPSVVVVGGTTMLLGGVAALRRRDAKQLLAYGTVSQLGLLVVLFGVGDDAATAAGVAVLVAHALFKSALFLTIGAVEHATASRDISVLDGVGRALPVLAGAAALATMSMIGVPPLVGFVAKESALAALADGDGAWLTSALAVVVIGSVLTTAYSIRLWWGLFGTKRSTARAGLVNVAHPAGPLLVAPVVVLAGLSLAGGVAATSLADLLRPAGEALSRTADVHLALVPGWHLPLALSASIVAAGTLLAAVLGRRGHPVAGASTVAERWYSRTYNGLVDGARSVTRVTQSGSLPLYAAVTFAVVVGVLAAALVRGAATAGSGPVLADSVLQAVVAMLGAAMAVAVIASRRRIVSVVLLGGVGQALTVLFLLYGAPDLALTQFMVETLMIVAFVLVLRHLPREYSSPPSWAPRALRIGLSAAVGITFAWFAFAAGSNERPSDVTAAVERLSLVAAGGRNVVNVTIVDFRGVDTLGEITVFGIAAIGVANIVTTARRAVARPTSTVGPAARIGATSMILDQVVRMIFHLTLLVSLYICLRGHNAPGGGFAGGLIAGAAFVFQILTGPSSRRPARVSMPPIALIGLGMVMAVATGLTPLVLGNDFLESAVVHLDVPLVGDVKLVSAGIFDLGVYVLVIGVVILVLDHLASRTHSGGPLAEEVA